MKILLINQAFYPDVVASGQYLADLAKGLVQQGHEVTVLTSRRAYDNPQIVFPHRECWEGAEIHRIFATGLGKGARWKRVIDFATFILFCVLKLFFIPRHDVVLAMTSPPLISFIAARYASFRKSRFVYWVLDLNPDEAIAAGWLSKTSFLGRFLGRMSRSSMHRASNLVLLDRFMEARILKKKIRDEKISIVPPWSHDDSVRFDPVGRKRFRKENGMEGKFVVMHSGNHSPCHPLDTILESARLLSQDPRFLFCFVGGGSEFIHVKEFADQHRLQNILCLPYQPLERLAASLSAADLHLVVMGEAYVGLIHPCKVYNILRVGAPLLYIGPNRGHIADVLDRLGTEAVYNRVDHGDVSGAVQFIEDVALHTPGSIGVRSISPLVNEFSKEKLLPRMVEIIEGKPALAPECQAADPAFHAVPS